MAPASGGRCRRLESGERPARPAAGSAVRRCASFWLGLLYLISFVPPAAPSHHEWWEEGVQFGYKWFDQDWVRVVRDF